MRKLIMCRGIPGSGKSYWANQQAHDDPNVTIVSSDDIRDEYGAMTGGYQGHKAEYHVTQEVRSRIREALKAGKTVISTDTNLTHYHEYRMRELAVKYKAAFEIKEFDTPLEVCIERDALRTDHHHVGADKIAYYNQILLGFKASKKVLDENQDS
jgi:predicted kinase